MNTKYTQAVHPFYIPTIIMRTGRYCNTQVRIIHPKGAEIEVRDAPLVLTDGAVGHPSKEELDEPWATSLQPSFALSLLWVGIPRK